MAGANGPTSAGGTAETPNPKGGAVEKPAVGGKAGAPAAVDAETPTGSTGSDGSASLDKDAQD